MNQQLASPDFRIEIYPSGLRVRKGGLSKAEPPDCDERGDITTLSHKAARRLREWFMTKHVFGMSLFAVTLTTHAIYSPNEWRAICMRFRQSVKRAGFAGVWRVELQKRKTPHLHVAFWLPASESVNDVRTLWLRATEEQNDVLAFEHAVYSKAINQDEAGWAVYMGLHDGKHKIAQLGWLGKQWGIWNREKYVDRLPAVFDLTARQHVAFLRFLRKWDVADRMRRQRTAEARQDAEMIAKIKASNGGVLPSCFSVVPSPVRRPSPRHFHRGNLLRLMVGDIPARILEAMRSSVICHISKLSPL